MAVLTDRHEHTTRWLAALALLACACAFDQPVKPQPVDTAITANRDAANEPPVSETPPAAVAALDPERCGRFTLQDIEDLCSELEADCGEECEVLRAKIGADPVRADSFPSQVMMFCGRHAMRWFEPEKLVVDGCFPRPWCYTTEVARNDDLNAHGTKTGWQLLLTTWMDEGGICHRWRESGVPAGYECFRLNADDTVSYVNRGPHGETSLTPIYPVTLAAHFSALGVMIDGGASD
jgi:hypothetical protein